MGFNYFEEKILFKARWRKLENEYRAAGFDEEGILAMHEFDWELFCKERTFRNRVQYLTDVVSDDVDDDDPEVPCMKLYKRPKSTYYLFDENSFHGRHDWIETIDDPVLVEKLKALSDADKELLTLYTQEGYSQAEIAALQGCRQSVISRKLSRLEKYFF